MSREVDAFGMFCLRWLGGGGLVVFFGGYIVAILGGVALDSIGGRGVAFSHDLVAWTKPIGVGLGVVGVGLWALASAASGAGTDNEH